jgi:hypothetical protein
VDGRELGAGQGGTGRHLVEKIEHDGFTTFRGGFTYTEEAFLNMWEQDRAQADPGMTSFKPLFEKSDLAAKIKAKDVREVWWQYVVNYDEAIQKLPPPGATFLKAARAM